jgi:DNA invertase Pin-like site-specific DNA recombinase
MSASAEPSPIAYSYIRFSDPSQAAGDSLRRQTEATAEWCQRNGIRLDTSLTLRDLGVSAFKGRHRTDDKHCLAQFLKLADRGRIPPGSFLVIENLDRLTREDERTALRLWMDILDRKISIVQLHPETVFRHDKSDMMDIMRAIIELSRGHSESRIKSERVGAKWEQRRKTARGGAGVLTRKLPAWVRERGGKLVAIPERAAVVKRVFDLAGSGHGLYTIMRRLTDEGVPAFGPSGRWSISYLHLMLSDRRATGEFQLRTRGKPDGPPVPDYFPRIVTDEAFERARLGRKERHRRPGRLTGDVNVFQGLLRGARDGMSYAAAAESLKQSYRILRSTAPRSGEGKPYSFPYAVFERAVLSQLAEIDPHEILNGDGGPDETLALSGQLAEVESSITLICREMDEHGESPTLFKRLRAKEELQRDLAARLAEARQKASHPLAETWGEAQSLLGALDAAADPAEARLRLRSVLRQIVDGIWLLVVPRGHVRLCAVQIWFKKDGAALPTRHRDYLILHRRPKANAAYRQEGGWSVRSFADVAGLPKGADLREPADARKLEAILAAAPLA